MRRSPTSATPPTAVTPPGVLVLALALSATALPSLALAKAHQSEPSRPASGAKAQASTGAKAQASTKAPAIELVEPEPGTVTAVDGPPPAGGTLELDTTLPDPPPRLSAARWLLDLRYRHGAPRLVSTTRADRNWPAPTPRVFGRFALEAYHDGELLERVRFDFPMVHEPAERKGRGGMAGLDFERKLSTRIGVYFPLLPQTSRFELVDRATGRRWSVPIPSAGAIP